MKQVPFFRPEIEALENRLVLSASYYWNPTGANHNFDVAGNWSKTWDGTNFGDVHTEGPGSDDNIFLVSGNTKELIINKDLATVNDFFAESGYTGIISFADDVTGTESDLIVKGEFKFSSSATMELGDKEDLFLQGTGTFLGGNFVNESETSIGEIHISHSEETKVTIEADTILEVRLIVGDASDLVTEVLPDPGEGILTLKDGDVFLGTTGDIDIGKHGTLIFAGEDDTIYGAMLEQTNPNSLEVHANGDISRIGRGTQMVEIPIILKNTPIAEEMVPSGGLTVFSGILKVTGETEDGHNVENQGGKVSLFSAPKIENTVIDTWLEADYLQNTKSSTVSTLSLHAFRDVGENKVETIKVKGTIEIQDGDLYFQKGAALADTFGPLRPDGTEVDIAQPNEFFIHLDIEGGEFKMTGGKLVLSAKRTEQGVYTSNKINVKNGDATLKNTTIELEVEGNPKDDESFRFLSVKSTETTTQSDNTVTEDIEDGTAAVEAQTEMGDPLRYLAIKFDITEMEEEEDEQEAPPDP